MPLNIVRDDLCNMRADAVVLPANEQLVIDGGASGAVARIAGRWRLQRACRKIGECPTGGAVATRAFSFPAKHLIHAVGPVWRSDVDSLKLLRSAYREALGLAVDLGCASVALPLLSAGVRGCPAHVSLSIALDMVEELLERHDIEVTLVLFDRQSVAAGLDFLGDLERRIDDATASYIRQSTDSYYAAAPPPGAFVGTTASAPQAAPARRELNWPYERDAFDGTTAEDLEDLECLEDLEVARAPEPRDARSSGFGYAPPTFGGQPAGSAPPPGAAFPPAARSDLPRDTGSFAPVSAPMKEAAEDSASFAAPLMAALASAESLEDRLGNMESGFSQTLLQLIDESGLTDAQVYRRANMSRQHFSKIRNNVGYRPSKTTVLSLCIALRLDLNSTRDLLERAGFALTHASKLDIIVEYFIERGEYDPFKINETLFYFDQPLLGG